MTNSLWFFNATLKNKSSLDNGENLSSNKEIATRVTDLRQLTKSVLQQRTPGGSDIYSFGKIKT